MLTNYSLEKHDPLPPENLKELFSSTWIDEEVAEILRWREEKAWDYAEFFERKFIADVIDLIALGHPQPTKLADACRKLLEAKAERVFDEFTP